ncbi:oligosaccharide repeat unit polymerase [Liquorilactobacillus nagelii DSM 13675]|uniref:O-antigen polymerase n=1 Tax=Liquorilactobacillus nagelii TaxID=82688 RepID=UPI00070CE13F|nr:O-antigen polymerase [Liquorilactobacillus nagelii]QYH54137.1 oligosaccharide repeat unit polymerase [Liquorilactobacillus nagelii DSM 13675]
MLCIVLYVKKGDFVFPVSIVLESFLISMVIVLLQINQWDAYISLKTFSVLSVGVISYTTVGLICSENFKFDRVGNIPEKKEYRPPYINARITIAVIIIEILLTFKIYIDVRQSSLSIGGFSNFSEMIGKYRNGSSLGYLQESISNISKYGLMSIFSIAYIYIYILILNIFQKGKNKISLLNCFLSILPVLIASFCSILIGSRSNILNFVFAALVLYYILFNKDKKNTFSLKEIKLLMKYLIVFLIVILAFSSIRTLVGRTSEYGFIDYISKYIGAPIKLFDMYLNNPSLNIVANPQSSNIVWGQETFKNFWRGWGSITNNNDLNSLIVNKEWRMFNGFSLGNIYTAFRVYYNDFGLIGVVLLSALHSSIFCVYYNFILNKVRFMKKNKICFSVLFYMFICNALFEYSSDDILFQIDFSFVTLEYMFLFVLFDFLLVRLSNIKMK